MADGFITEIDGATIPEEDEAPSTPVSEASKKVDLEQVKREQIMAELRANLEDISVQCE